MKTICSRKIVDIEYLQSHLIDNHGKGKTIVFQCSKSTIPEAG